MEVEFKNITKRYGSVVAVRNLNLTIEKGAFHFLLGPSGCGKTTTLRLLAGLEPVSEGSLLFNGADVTKKPASERGIGMVFQNYALWPHMTVSENIRYGLRLRKLGRVEMEKREAEVLELTQLTQLKGRFPSQLSGGQQQRVALARALAIRPSVLLLDEPLSNLDAKLRLEMRDNISRIHTETKITTFYVTHDQKEALSMGTCITVMHRGIEVQTGSPRELYIDPHTAFLAGFIGETNLIHGTFVESTDQGANVQTPFGVLRATKVYGDFAKGDKVSLSVRPEAVKLDPGTDDNRIVPRLSQATYLGDIEQLKLSYGIDQTLKVNVADVDDAVFGLGVGEEVPCYIAPSKVIVFPFEAENT